VARNPAKLPADILAAGAARVITADLATPGAQALESAVVGAGAVLSALGPHNNADAGIAASGTAAIITAMRAAGVRRIVAISASPVATTPSPGRPDPPRHDPGDGFIMRHVGVRTAKALFGKVYHDLAAMEDLLRDSGLHWTILRPPRLTGKPPTEHYRTAAGHNVRGGRSIPPRRSRPPHARCAGPARNHRPGHRHRHLAGAAQQHRARRTTSDARPGSRPGVGPNGRSRALRRPVGSSAKTTASRVISARAIATRCCWPPDSWPGR
jgi:hypothetical protein